MITKFKIFENLEDSSKLSVGDYVMFSDVDGFNKNFKIILKCQKKLKNLWIGGI